MELSVEFFPPKTTEGENKLHLVRERFSETLKPAFYSVTFGAGGSTQSGTLKVAIFMLRELLLPRIYLALVARVRVCVKCSSSIRL